MLSGTYINKIDEKGRIRMPPKFKEILKSGYYVTKGDNNCLFVLSAEEFNALLTKFKSNINLMDSDAQKAQRLFFSNSYQAEEDNQGRVRLEKDLLEYSKIVKDVTIIGAGDRVEIWSAENWKKYNENVNYSAQLNNLSKLV